MTESRGIYDARRRTALDGNAAAGPLSEIFAMDVTSARGQCEQCGNVAHVAEAVLFTEAPGLVARCRECDAVLFRVVESEDRVWLDVRGLTFLEIRRS